MNYLGRGIVFAAAVLLGSVVNTGCGDDDTAAGGSGGTVSDGGGATTASGGSGGSGGGGGGGAGGAGGSLGAVDAYFWGPQDTGAVRGRDAVTFSPQGGAVETGAVAVVVSPDRTQIAVAINTDESDARFVVNVYPADGSGAPTTVAELNTLPNSGAVPRRMNWSPDGTRIAFLADGEYLDDDLVYVVPADGTDTTPKVVCPIPTGNQTVQEYVWVDGTHIAYVGDLETNDIDGIWSVDVTDPTPSPVELAPVGSMSIDEDVAHGIPPAVDAQGRVYYLADYVSDDTFRLYRADGITGQNQELVPGADMMVDAEPASLTTYGISPDGQRLVFAAHTDETYSNLFSLDLPSTTPTQLTNYGEGIHIGFHGPSASLPVVFDAVGSKVAVLANWEVDSTDAVSVFVVDVPNATASRVLTPAEGIDGTPGRVGFSRDGARLYSIGDYAVEGQRELYMTTDFTTEGQNPSALAVSADTEGVITDMVVVE